ncbi:MAG: FK506-binding protein 2 [Patescibacteria group bacterium]|jgi:FKBP-type peptidyl-prolyl cis-trans isomerase|nr:FK506-binding protein 2 [Patescibacteria group bacterium]
MKTATALIIIAAVLVGGYFLINRNSTGMEAQTAQNGDVVGVHYTGKLVDGTVFDSSIPRGEPIQFTLGSGQVIAGWDQGILGMAVGEKKVLTIPPELGYGAQDHGPIPGGSTLIFDVELVSIN